MFQLIIFLFFFFFNDTATTEIYTLSLHDALPIYLITLAAEIGSLILYFFCYLLLFALFLTMRREVDSKRKDRKSTRLNSSHSQISYAVFCLKKKKKPLTNNITRIEYYFRLGYRYL